MPLALVWRAVQEHFAQTPPLSSYKLADKLGLSGSVGGALHTLTTFLLKQEARCARDFQKNCKVGGASASPVLVFFFSHTSRPVLHGFFFKHSALQGTSKLMALQFASGPTPLEASATDNCLVSSKEMKDKCLGSK